MDDDGVLALLTRCGPSAGHVSAGRSFAHGNGSIHLYGRLIAARTAADGRGFRGNSCRRYAAVLIQLRLNIRIPIRTDLRVARAHLGTAFLALQALRGAVLPHDIAARRTTCRTIVRECTRRTLGDFAAIAAVVGLAGATLVSADFLALATVGCRARRTLAD